MRVIIFIVLCWIFAISVSYQIPNYFGTKEMLEIIAFIFSGFVVGGVLGTLGFLYIRLMQKRMEK